MSLRRWLQLAGLGTGVFLARSVLRRRRELDLRDKLVLVTGGSRGLGLVLARELVSRGARVAICARDDAELGRAKRDLEERSGTAFAYVCDVTDRDDVMRMVATIEDEVGSIDALINNAGVIQVGPLELMSCADFELALDVNLRGPLHTMMAVAPRMQQRNAGRIVNIASIGGKIAVPHLAPYSTSKFALVGLSQAMRAELAKDNVLVSTVCPGLMRTGSPLHAWFKGDAAKEYTWFSIADSLTLTSVSAESAAKRIVQALVYGEADVIISPQARLATMLQAIAPGFVQEALGLVARYMPSGTARTATEGKDLDAPLVPSVLTKQGDEAALRNNER
jgi:NAD(P)-dependent dehydrogenase (short-subunit alcohol dehydrogenase family)